MDRAASREKAEPEDEPNGEECGSGYGSLLRLYRAPPAALDSGGRAGRLARCTRYWDYIQYPEKDVAP